MKIKWWFCLPLWFSACVPDSGSGQWDGNYVGYYHHNRQDTTAVTLVFSGRYFAAAPYDAPENTAAEGMFQQQKSTLIFENLQAGGALLEGTYQFQYAPDGSVRLWQEQDADFREIILRQQ